MKSLINLDNHPNDWFPSTDRSLHNPNGLLACGGELNPQKLLAAYRRGIFPWPHDNVEKMLWWSPDPRMILYPDSLTINKSLRKRIKRGQYQVSLDNRFDEVIEYCSHNTFRQASWINTELINAYTKLYRLGHAHSIEILDQGRLIGGLYGIAMGGVFFGESMFSLKADAAKLALYHLCQHLVTHNYTLIDCQIESCFLARFGAVVVSRDEFEQLLAKFIKQRVSFC